MIIPSDCLWDSTGKPGVLPEMYPAPRQCTGGGLVRTDAAEWQGAARWQKRPRAQGVFSRENPWDIKDFLMFLACLKFKPSKYIQM